MVEEIMAIPPAPAPAALAHLKPTNALGLVGLGIVTAATSSALWLSARPGWLPWLAGQTILAVALVQWFAVLHECGHRTMFRTRRLNTIVGSVAGVLTMIPFRSWVRVHGRHHKWTGWQDIDPTTAALVPRPLGRGEKLLVDTCWRLWIPLFSVLYRVENYWNRRRLHALFPSPKDRAAIDRGIAIHLAASVVVAAAVGPGRLLILIGLGVFLSLIAEDLLLLSQHTHVPQHISGGRDVLPVPPIEQDVYTRSLRLPSWASALLLHFDAHGLHHMYPFVPGYHLRRIPYTPSHEVGWWTWLRHSKRMEGSVLLFQNRRDTGFEI
jgi:acyl-lipid omega-6 desaturase (Delta-12 desaturase)